MKTRKITTVLSLAAAVSLCHGSVIFENDGTISPWGHTLKDTGASLTEVSSPTYAGSSALKHFANFPGTGDVSVHCEVARDPTGVNGDDRYYGWAFMLGSDWPANVAQASALCQLTGHGACGFNQNDFVRITGSTFEDGAGGGSNCSPTSHTYTIGGIPSRNVWHRLVIRKLWKGDNTGITEIWLDGSKKVSANNVATGWSDLSGGYAWHVGVYAGFVYGTPETRTVWTDHARVATTYAEADPANWGGGEFTGIFQIKNEASNLVLNNQGFLTNGSAITQWSPVTSSNLDWQLIPASNGYYQINSCKSGKAAAVQSASTADGAGIIQWSFGTAGNDQWQPVQNSDGSYTFYNLHSGLVLDDPGSSTSTSKQMDQWSANGGANQKFNLIRQ